MARNAAMALVCIISWTSLRSRIRRTSAAPTYIGPDVGCWAQSRRAKTSPDVRF